ncbi:Aste57867_21301 [Aphanomyces stellatus]|uniref:Aste57867_21301 protein n=1 Tax=Aphanomyces stellatus TaxID=120398 RepID=A0A485LHU8_9STRA|nr:hypothetical protein As57867_021232 [Aphanomyces stellatus]VFT97973.1 Aste57867_21301 [Aphanomyces stellatus]
MKQRSLRDFFAKTVSTPDSISKRMEIVDETDSDVGDDATDPPKAKRTSVSVDDDEMNVTYGDDDESQATDFARPKRISFSPSQCSEPDEPESEPGFGFVGGDDNDDDDAQQDTFSQQQAHPWSEDFAPTSFSQMYSQQSYCDFSTPQDQPVVHMSQARSPSPVKKRPRTLPSLRVPFGVPSLVDNETNSEAGSLVMESPAARSPPRLAAPQLCVAPLFRRRFLHPTSSRSTPFGEINTNPFAAPSNERKRKKKTISPPLWLGATVSASKYLSEFVEQELLGSGSFSKVYKCIKRFDGWTYAIKKSKRHFRGLSDKQRALREVHALAALGSSPHIVRYFDAWIEEDLLYIQLEHMRGCSLQTFLDDAAGGNFVPEPTLRKVLAHIAKALRDMHAIKLVHMDIKVENVLVTSQGVYKLGDLGTVVASDGSMEIMEGDNRYLSRELLEGNRMHLSAGDVFALGATLYELARGEGLPSAGEAWQHLRDGNLTVFRHYSNSLQHLIASMMHPDPLARPSADEILRHEAVVEFV